MNEVSAARVQRLKEAMEGAGIRAFFLRDTSTIAWLTAFDDVFDEESAHAVLVTPHLCELHTDSRYAGACRKAAQGGPFTIHDEPESHEKWLADIFQSMHGGQADAAQIVLGIESTMMLGEYRLLERELARCSAQPRLEETKRFGMHLRSVKDAAEVERLRAAQAITDAAFSHIVDYMKPGMTERQVQVELEDFMVRHGAAGLAFSSIVATGANGASPHAIPGATRLEAGQCVVMDFGARAQGYCSDMTRTVFVGAPDPHLASAYETLRRANEEVEALLAPGVTGAQAQELAESILAEGGYAGKMGHALGHGVGIDIHEEPVLAPRNNEPLQVGNVVTVEPGIYLEGDFGMRLEDFGIIDDGGFQVFTQSSHDMVII